MDDQEAAGILREYGRVRVAVERALEQLSPEEQRILELTMIVPNVGNLEELCAELGVEKSTIYRRRDKALARFAGACGALRAGKPAGRRNRGPVVQ